MTRLHASSNDRSGAAAGGFQTGYQPLFPTGKAFMLWKRIARGYYLVDTRIASTYLNLRDPHDYKVIMTGGRILCYVDGRLVIEYTDIPSPDEQTKDARLPGVPSDSGLVGLRSTGARVWFDNFSVVGRDAPSS